MGLCPLEPTFSITGIRLLVFEKVGSLCDHGAQLFRFRPIFEVFLELAPLIFCLLAFDGLLLADPSLSFPLFVTFGVACFPFAAES